MRTSPVPDPSPQTIDQTLQAAVLALRSRRPAEAERLAFAVLKSNRSHALAAQILGEALLLQNRPAEAVAALRGPARRGGDPATETLLGMALVAAGRPDQALEQFRLAVTRRPPFLLAFLQLGGRLGDMGAFDEAVTVLEAGLALAPDANVLRLALGNLHLKRNDRPAARRALSHALDAAPDQPDALLALAKVTALDGEYAEAAELFQRVLPLRPDDSGAKIGLARCLLALGRRDDGEALLRSATQADPDLIPLAVSTLAAAPSGRLFLRPSAAAKFMTAEGH